MQSGKEKTGTVELLNTGGYGVLPHQPQLASLARNLANRWVEEALIESEARYRIVTQTVVDAIVTVDDDGEILFVNNSAENVFGFGASDLLGRSLKLLIPGYRPFDDPAACHQREMTGRHRDGHSIALEVSFGQFTQGSKTLATGILRDISSRKRVEEARGRAEEELRRANETLRALIEANPLAIVAFDFSEKIFKWNPAAVRMFGWTEEEMMGKPLPPAFGSRDERVRLMAALRRGELITVETTRVRKDGVLINIMISAAPLAGPDGSPSGVVAVIADITEQKRLEDQLRQAQKMEAVGRLAGGIAHDFNNLLTIITGYDEMLLNSLPAETRERGYAQEILNSAEKASALTRQLLAFSRRQVANPTLLDINQVISDLTKMLRRLIGEDIDLVIVPGRDVIAVKADKGHIEQIVINLVVNARDAMPAGGRITIETGLADLGPDRTPMELGAAAGRFVSMSVTDTGQGMSEEVRSRLFEPFFTTKPEGHGTGLGLSTVYGIVRQNHGDIWVYSEPGKGSSFKVYLPAEDRSPQTELDPEDRILQQGKETVLLVEDEAGLRGMIQELLARLGYTVLTAANGLEAIRIASRHPQPIDLLLTDVVLPKESGSELAERVLRLRPHTRVLFMSGYPPETCVQHGVLQARAEFLEKPFALEALATKVRAVLDGNDPAANPKLPPAA